MSSTCVIVSYRSQTLYSLCLTGFYQTQCSIKYSTENQSFTYRLDGVRHLY